MTPRKKKKKKTSARGLLPRDALKGICLGISVSQSPDLLRLGLIEAHFRLALAEIARTLKHGGRAVIRVLSFR